MRSVINRMHPRKIQGTEPVLMGLCSTRAGWHSCCFKSVRSSDFAPFGVGIVAYFQFMKYMACIFFLMTVLSIPTMMVFLSGSGNFELSPKVMVTSFSLGNLGQS